MSLLYANWSKSLNIKPRVESFIEREENLQVFLKTLRQVSRIELPSLYDLGLSDIKLGSKVHISAIKEMQADLIAFSLNLVVIDESSNSRIRSLFTSNLSTTSSL